MNRNEGQYRFWYMNLGLEASKDIWQATLGYLYGVSELGCGVVEPSIKGFSNWADSLSSDGMVEQTRVRGVAR